MPFGLRTAPYLFCKLLTLAVSKEEAIFYGNVILSVLANAGLSIELEKSKLAPQPIIIFLGVTVNLSTKMFTPSQDNIDSCIIKVVDFLENKKHYLKQFQSLSCSLNLVAPVTHLGTQFGTFTLLLPTFPTNLRRPIPPLKSKLETWKERSFSQTCLFPTCEDLKSLYKQMLLIEVGVQR